MIKARCIVDVDISPSPVGLGVFRVEVWGDEPHDFVRTYTIRAKSDNLAAQEALNRFVSEIEAPLEKD